MSEVTEVDDGIAALLEQPRYELMPFDSFYEQLDHIPTEVTLTITASPQKPVDVTVEFATDAVEAGYDVVPHIAARAVEDAEHLVQLADAIVDAGITDIFVPGGDLDEPKGEFESAYQLLVALDELGYSFENVGITGYPEGHPAISDEELNRAMHEKEPYATYLVTQICYDPARILSWIDRVRADDVMLPVHVGIPGVMRYDRLIGISQRVGVGQSIRFVRKTSGILDFVKQMLGSRGTYTPDALIDGLGPHASDERYRIAGVHLYTFNRSQDTEAWRQQRLRP